MRDYMKSIGLDPELFFVIFFIVLGIAVLILNTSLRKLETRMSTLCEAVSECVLGEK